MKIFFRALFLNALVWIVLIPIWHTPDEQAHFGQVAFVSEKGRNPKGGELDLTEEIYASEQLLGTLRDKYGNNKFTFHPEYRIDYTDSYIGKYEASISALSKSEAKKQFIYTEASRYPILYYLPATWLYRIFYDADIFIKVFLVRLWSLVIFIGTIYIVFRIGKLLFPKDNLSSLTLPILVGFQPMMVFSNIGVNSDALGNFLFVLFLYLCVRILTRQAKKRDLIATILAAILAAYSKPQFIIALPLLVFLFFWMTLRDFSGSKRRILVHIVLSILILLSVLYFFPIGPVKLIFRLLEIINVSSFIKYSLEYTLPHAVKEVLPWYWGIYDWLGVTYSRGVHRIINRILFLAGIGVLIWLYKVVKNRDWKKKEFEAIVFLNIAAIVYFIALSFYDWMLWYTSKYQLGIQGRYFFPVISVHMLMLLIGFSQLFPTKVRFKEFGIKLLGILMIILNFFALYTVGKTYYSLWPISTFIIQVSQYKPLLIKGYGFIIVFVGFLISMLIFLLKYLTYQSKKTFS